TARTPSSRSHGWGRTEIPPGRGCAPSMSGAHSGDPAPEGREVPMRSRRTKGVLALTAVLVVLWSSVAVASNGDPVTAGQTTTATQQTFLDTTQSTGQGFLVRLAGTSTGAAVRGTNTGTGTGLQGTAVGANAYAVAGSNTSASA